MALTGENLINAGVLTREQLDFCLLHQNRLRANGIAMPIGQIILLNGFATKDAVENAISESMGLKNLQIPDSIRTRYKIYIHGVKNNILTISSLSPLNGDKESLKQELKSIGVLVDEILEVPLDRKTIIEDLRYREDITRDLLRYIHAFNKDPEDGQILKQVMDGIIMDAINSRASDIHIDRAENKIHNWVSYRIDGLLQYRYLLTDEAIGALVARLKTEAKLDITETRIPQDGRISYYYKDRVVDIRLATMPIVSGETLTLRILDPQALKNLSELFAFYPEIADMLTQITQIRHKTGGVVLITGVTGSGKSTTMHGILKQMNRINLNIMTVEHPIEYKLAYTRQTPINPDGGITYANILRAQLRNDPDVMVIGEMRDSETVEIALRAAESGHLVISTLHAIDSIQSINRLISMIPDEYRINGSFVVANYLKAVINQRLVRTLCPHCSKVLSVTELEIMLKSNGKESVLCNPYSVELCETSNSYNIFCAIKDKFGLQGDDILGIASADGCSKCSYTGYLGRTLVVDTIFFSNNRELRREMENIILVDRRIERRGTLNKLTKLQGVYYHSIEDSVFRLLKNKLIDFTTAFDILGLKIYQGQVL